LSQAAGRAADFYGVEVQFEALMITADKLKLTGVIDNGEWREITETAASSTHIR
jgi:hypothetical protein